MSVVTRFAPSPTGDLHIGGVRTAIFNWLFAKSQGGKFLLRIEDTDKSRSDAKYLDSIINSLSWLDINWDENIVFQSKNIDYHCYVANKLLDNGCAYKCYLSNEEVQALKEKNDKIGLRKYRDFEEELNAPYVIRFKMPLHGTIEFHDHIKSNLSMNCSDLDDFVILRQDSTPTYLLACVADDHKMGITHVIRGDDHVANTFKQIAIYKSLDWKIPSFYHIPLIHSEDGKKLSKRNHDVGISYYRKLGILPDALFNYLLRLGWSSGNTEIISRDKAVECFTLGGEKGRSIQSPARLNFDKLLYINGFYLRNTESDRLYEMIENELKIEDRFIPIVKCAIDYMKIRSRTLVELKEFVTDIFGSELPKYVVPKPELSHIGKNLLHEFDISKGEEKLRELATAYGVKFKEIASFLRFALSGREISPSIFEMVQCLGYDLSRQRIENALRL
ncbi:MAG: glutamate--tRNA ligase [Alphaproteobacteria bacterium]|nr:MAG: glutamate--tRNA ligase [Alphaproteobacteria bacterium]